MIATPHALRGLAPIAPCLVLCLTVSGCSEPEAVIWPTRSELAQGVQTAAAVPDPALRAEIVRLAARSGVDELSPLVAAAAGDDSPLVVGAALESALRKGDRAQAEVLYERLAAGGEAARRAGLDLYVSYASREERARELERALGQPNAAIRRFAVHRILSDRDADAVVAQTVMNQLLDMGDPTIAAEVADLLMVQGEPSRLHGVYERLLSDDVAERLSAMRVFAVAPSFDIWPYLRWYRQNGDAEVRRLAILGLARLGDEAVVDDLREVLLLGEPEIMPLAIRALAGLSDRQDLRQLESYKSDTRPEIRGAVARTLIALEAAPEELIGFIEDPDGDISSYVTRYLIESDPALLSDRICAQLRLTRDPMPLLRFLWLMWMESHSDVLTNACRPQLEALLGAEVDAVRYLAARLYFSVVAPDPNRWEAGVSDDPQFLYAYLEASLDWDPESYRELYHRLLDHELVIIRAIAAVGLLKTTLP